MRLKIAAALILMSSPAFAGPQCTTEPETAWLSKAEMMNRIAKTEYSVDVFKKTSGNCYEIYGFDKEENKVEIYFNPVDGSIVKKEMH